MANYYEMLGVNTSATASEIEVAIDARYNQWRALVTHHDPNVVNQANQELQKLEMIRGTLMDVNKRAGYDAAVGLGNTIGGLADPSAIAPAVRRPPLPPSPPGMRLAPSAASQRTDAWECARCQTPNPPNTRFCEKCGNALGKDCPNCVKLIKTAATFCPHCGKNIEQAAQEKRVREEEAEKQKQLEAVKHAEQMKEWQIERERSEQVKKIQDDAQMAWINAKDAWGSFWYPWMWLGWFDAVRRWLRVQNAPHVQGDEKARSTATNALLISILPLVCILGCILFYGFQFLARR